MKTNLIILGLSSALLLPVMTWGQHSVARIWNEVLLESIRNDFARPTVHARNLFHVGVAMYDAWALYDDNAETFLMGKVVGNFESEVEEFPLPANIDSARVEAISYACYRLIRHRFSGSPGAAYIAELADSVFISLGYDPDFGSLDYVTGPPAALGNYIAQTLIDFGFQDGSNEQGGYENMYYVPSNPPLIVELPGNPDIVDPNRWQPLTLDIFIDQAGNPIPIRTPPFLSPEWGIVTPFALQEEDLTIYQRDGFDYWVYHDPGPPPLMSLDSIGPLEDEYKWGFALVAVWSGHLDYTDPQMWDISPATIGNISEIPTNVEDYRNFYDILGGGDASVGHELNPVTGQPYEAQLVSRGDYARVLAEFWADGPDSETPPGHWFTILNYVNDHAMLTKKWRGQGDVLDDLEWDVRTYLTLGGAMHDVAVAVWGIKGWYDYIRPVSAIRSMADRGQCTDTSLANYSPDGIPLYEGYIEVVDSGDALAGNQGQHIGKIKLFAWQGPDYVPDPTTTVAGVDWILAENWWPYQRPSFITPPFAGYISGHSTYSRAAAEVLTLMTGDPFFPGGMGEFQCPHNEFLVFEDGPSEDLVLQWATYRDASDQCSLSRIWGGIHPPADDIPGRHIGIDIGVQAFLTAEELFEAETVAAETLVLGGKGTVYPNPLPAGSRLKVEWDGEATEGIRAVWINTAGQEVMREDLNTTYGAEFTLSSPDLAGPFFVRLKSGNIESTHIVVLEK